MSSPTVKMNAKYGRLCGWLIISCTSALLNDKIKYLFIIYSDENGVLHNNVFTQSSKFDIFCPDDDFIWLPGKKNEVTLPFSLYLDMIPKNEYFVSLLKKFELNRYSFRLMRVDDIKKYSEKPNSHCWKGFKIFVLVISKSWGISSHLAAYLVSGSKDFWPIKEDEFYKRLGDRSKRRLYLLLRIELNFKSAFGDESNKRVNWLNMKNNRFNGKSAIEMITSEPAGIVVVSENSCWINNY